MKKVLPFLLILMLGSCSSPDYDFRFFAIGDMPYHLPADFQRFERLIAAVNKEDPAFTVHVGDIKSGGTPCSDAYFLKIHHYFQQFQHPVIYTPGDNEWTDCYRSGAGSYDPLERLDKIREIFYKNNKNLGNGALPLISQHTFNGYEKFVENVIWDQEELTFGTLHVVGSNNNFKTDSAAVNEAYKERNAANLFWLQEIFNHAKAKQSKGLAIFLHASLDYQDSEKNGFRNFTKKLRDEAMAYKNPILLVYGDHHSFLIEKPLRDNNGKVLKHFTSLMVFGDQDIHAVEIRVNKKDEAIFEIKQYFVDGN